MSLQEAFLKAVDSDPRSPLVTRVRKAIRRGGGSRTEDAQRQTLRDFLSSHAALQAQNAHDARMREICVALRLWLGRPAQRANVAADKVLTP